MSSNEEKIIYKKLYKFKQLSECIDKRCDELSESSISAISLGQQLINLSTRIKKNCDVFENDLRSIIPSNETTNENDEFVISLNLLKIIGEEQCKNLREDEFRKLKLTLEIFTKNYLANTKDPVFEKLCELHYSESTNNNNENSTSTSTNLTTPSSSNADYIIREIFGSDSEESDSNSNDSKIKPQEKNDQNLISNEAISCAKSQNEVPSSTNQPPKDGDNRLNDVADISLQPDEDLITNGEISSAKSQDKIPPSVNPTSEDRVNILKDVADISLQQNQDLSTNIKISSAKSQDEIPAITIQPPEDGANLIGDISKKDADNSLQPNQDLISNTEISSAKSQDEVPPEDGVNLSGNILNNVADISLQPNQDFSTLGDIISSAKSPSSNYQPPEDEVNSISNILNDVADISLQPNQDLSTKGDIISSAKSSSSNNQPPEDEVNSIGNISNDVADISLQQNQDLSTKGDIISSAKSPSSNNQPPEDEVNSIGNISNDVADISLQQNQDSSINGDIISPAKSPSSSNQQTEDEVNSIGDILNDVADSPLQQNQYPSTDEEISSAKSQLEIPPSANQPPENGDNLLNDVADNSLQPNQDSSKIEEISSEKPQTEITLPTNKPPENGANLIECVNNILETSGGKNLSANEQESTDLHQKSDAKSNTYPETGNEFAEITMNSSPVDVENPLKVNLQQLVIENKNGFVKGTDSSARSQKFAEGDNSLGEIEATVHIDSLDINDSKPADNLEENTAEAPVSTQDTIIGSDRTLECSYEIDIDKSDFFSRLGLEKSTKQDNHENIKTIRDDLMEIFAEIECQEDENGQIKEIVDSYDDSSSETIDDEDKYSNAKVAAALKDLEDDSSDIESISDFELDSSSFEVDSCVGDDEPDLNKFEDVSNTKQTSSSVCNFVPKQCSVMIERSDLEKIKQELRDSNKSIQESTTADEGNIDVEKSSSHLLTKQCSVVLERIDDRKQNSELDSGTQSDNEDDVINRLCQLSNLENNNKRRRTSGEKGHKRKIKRKKRCLDLSGTETSDLSGYSSVSENEIKDEKIFEREQDDDYTHVDPSALLVEIICHTIHDSDSDSSTILSSEEEKEKKQKRRNTNKMVSKGKEVGSNKKGESWKDDPLLRGNLNVPCDKENSKVPSTEGNLSVAKSSKRIACFDSDSECERKKRIRTNTRRRYLDPNYSESDSSSDDFEDPIEDVEMNSKGDSDIEYIGSTSTNVNVINVDSDDEINKKNSRRNILSVLSTECLTESTQKAAKEEEARCIRLEEKKILRSSQESQGAKDSIILDVCSDGSKVTVDPNLSRKLFSHQIEGVKFMWDACYLSVDSLKSFSGTGCILAHNMGLGKTLQVVTLVHTLFNHPVTNTKHVLIVCPLSTVPGWKREFLKSLKIVKSTKNIKIITIESKYDRQTKYFLVNQWKETGGVLILGYEAFSRLTRDDSQVQSSSMRKALLNPGPDLVVCDEGHLLKNGKTVRTKALMEIKTKRRIALTGTPLQNNLNEYYYMVQFVKPNLLGTKLEFNRQFINPIMNGQYEDSLERDITLMKKRTHVLHRLLKNTVQRYEATELQKYLENMTDYALFIQLHPIQEKLYRKYIEKVKKRMDNNVANMRKDFKSFFVDYQILKFICSHPQLLQTMETQNLQTNKNAIKEKEVISEEPEIQNVEGLSEDWWKAECSDEIQTNIEFGTKLHVMMAIIEEAEKKGEKVLIFTSSLVELSSVEYFLKLKGTSQCPSWKPKRDYFRMDGTVPPSVRTNMCDMFNDEQNKTLRVFLMSHKVGGLGLNLVAANRVILLGANFNPSLDSQSIYRAYRFGQNKKVYIYRLLSMGTMEEKIYHRCISKLAIASRVVDKHQIARHYKNLDLEDLYTVDINLSLQRSTPAKPEDEILSSILLRFDCVHKYLQHQKLLENRPDEELNEEDQRKAWEEFKQMNDKEKTATEMPALRSVARLVRNQWNQIHSPPQLKPMETLDAILARKLPSLRMNPISPNQIPKVLPSSSTTMPGLPPNKKGIQENSLKYPPLNQSSVRPINQTKSSIGIPPRLIPISKENYEDAIKCMKNTAVNTLNKESTIAPINKNHSSLQNVIAKKKCSKIGPNPLSIGKLSQSKERLKMVNPKRTNWRWSSSEDFQKPGSSQFHPARKRNEPEIINQHAHGNSTDDVIVIDALEEEKQIKKQIDELRKRNVVTTAKTTREENPHVIDIT